MDVAFQSRRTLTFLTLELLLELDLVFFLGALTKEELSGFFEGEFVWIALLKRDWRWATINDTLILEILWE